MLGNPPRPLGDLSGICIEATLHQASRAEPIRTMGVPLMVTRCTRCNPNTPATSMHTILLTLSPFPCSGSSHCLRRGPLKVWNGPLYFCRDQTLRLSYCLYIISTAVYLPSPRKLLPANRPHPLPVYQNTLLWAVSLYSRFVGSCIFSKTGDPSMHPH